MIGSDLCRCGRTWSQHDENGQTWDQVGTLSANMKIRCNGFEPHPLPIPGCGPGCQNEGSASMTKKEAERFALAYDKAMGIAMEPRGPFLESYVCMGCLVPWQGDVRVHGMADDGRPCKNDRSIQ